MGSEAYKPRKLVLVEWLDSSGSDGWEHFRHIDESRDLRCRSVGWVTIESKTSLTITPHLAFASGRGTLDIPKVAILKVTKLRDGFAKKEQRDGTE